MDGGLKSWHPTQERGLLVVCVVCVECCVHYPLSLLICVYLCVFRCLCCSCYPYHFQSVCSSRFLTRRWPVAALSHTHTLSLLLLWAAVGSSASTQFTSLQPHTQTQTQLRLLLLMSSNANRLNSIANQRLASSCWCCSSTATFDTHTQPATTKKTDTTLHHKRARQDVVTSLSWSFGSFRFLVVLFSSIHPSVTPKSNDVVPIVTPCDTFNAFSSNRLQWFRTCHSTTFGHIEIK